MRKRGLYPSKHPFDAYPFEAFFYGSWEAVEFIRISNGTMTLQFEDSQYVIEEKVPFSNLRVRSRKATLSDCTCFLRPGVDICVLSTSQDTESSGEDNLEPVWIDAKINSIERRPHESRCACQFYINFYVTQDPFGLEKGTLSKDIKIVEVDQISILQKLERSPSEDAPHRWSSSEDCSSVQRTKLLLGKFLSDLSWLLVASVLKRITFDVRSEQNKIVYQIVGDDHDSYSSNSDKRSNAVNFRVDNEILIPIVVPFVSTDEASPVCDMREVDPLTSYDAVDLRRSKRRYVQPERFVGGDGFPELDSGLVRIGMIKTDKWKEDEMTLALALQVGMLEFPEKGTEGENMVRSCKIDSYEDFLVCKSKMKSREVKSDITDQREEQNQLAIVPLPDENDPIYCEQDHFHAEFLGNHSEGSKHYYIKAPPTMQRKNISDVEYMDFESRRESNRPNKKGKRRRYYSSCLERESFCEARTHGKRSLSASGYNEVIKTYIKNIDSTIKKEQPPVIEQWRNFQARNCLNQRRVCNETSSSEDEGESSETEMLWKEMELSIASSYLLEDNEDCNVEVPTKVVQKSGEGSRQFCRHEYKLDDEIGILCRLCGYVSTEIKDVSPPFMQYTSWITNNKLCSEEDSESKQTEDESLDLFCDRASSDMPLSEGTDNVWALIPDLRMKLHFHQKKAFEFLWRNIAGSLVPDLMDPAFKNRGGCVVSHSPGAGKTLLIIAFLASYLKLFPGKRPLVLAPKTTLYTWYKEIIKWELRIPVYQIHNGRTYRMFRQRAVVSPGTPKPGQDVMHVLDCLEKIQKWHAHPSILIMGYTSFLSLMREDSKFAHRRYMGEVLRKSPGILILDEGHNPRSTKSRLRKALMKVETDLRILLSGTLFQNNFGEYFNTLALARPKFVEEVLKELDPKFRRNKKGMKKEKPRILLEARARKFFIENANKINSSRAEDRMRGLNMLRNITNGFIDVYEGGSSDGLPGLQSYTLVMKSTNIQHEILETLQRERAEYKRFPLELELLITLGSIHPWLITTAACANKYFSMEELEEFEKHKLDFKKGSKVKFVVNLVNHCIVKKEKILIFCHNIAPINFFLEMFQIVYGWRKGKQVLVLQGDLELFERGRVMDKFEEPGGASKVLLASITACAEGVSLTAASRVVLLDSEWNPSKTKQAIARAFRPGQQKVVYVYQLLAMGTLEQEKYDRTTWKEWVSNMIFSEALVEDSSRRQTDNIEDDVLREIVKEDWSKSFHTIMKNEKA